MEILGTAATILSGWLLYRKRPSEAAGDAIAFPWLRILVRWAVGLCGGLGLGLFLSSFVLGGSRSLAKLLLCQVFMGLLCFVAAQMLLQKTFRVFRRSWKELAVLAAAGRAGATRGAGSATCGCGSRPPRGARFPRPCGWNGS